VSVHPNETHFFRRIRVGIRVRIRVKIGCSVTENCADISKPTTFLQKPCSSAESKVFRIKLKITRWRGVRGIHVGMSVHPDETHFFGRIRVGIRVRIWVGIRIGIRVGIRAEIWVGFRIRVRIRVRVRIRAGIRLSKTGNYEETSKPTIFTETLLFGRIQGLQN
jgi:hypothetical protein